MSHLDHPQFSKFRDAALKDAEVRAAYVAASRPESDYDRARYAIAALRTPSGLVLGDVIARLILDSGAVVPTTVPHTPDDDTRSDQ